MISFQPFFDLITDTPLEAFKEQIEEAIDSRFTQRQHGDLESWVNRIEALPTIATNNINFSSDAIEIGAAAECSISNQLDVRSALEMLHPWRKGPWNLFGISVDSEWRSNLKWNRIIQQISPLKGRNILDVGCGNLYYGWRMLNEQPRMVIGIDPSQKFLAQFALIKRFAARQPIHYLPMRSEDFPAKTECFDTIFSMGVLYHRRSPFDHLLELFSGLREGGELVLETLVIDGDRNKLLVPEDRYAQMPNVWFIPSCDGLEVWLKRTGFENVRLIDLSVTTVEEQRSTDWMRFHSLAEYLDPDDPSKTVEGYPAPKRASFIATKPYS